MKAKLTLTAGALLVLLTGCANPPEPQAPIPPLEPTETIAQAPEPDEAHTDEQTIAYTLQVPEPYEEVLIYTLATDTYFQQLALGTTGGNILSVSPFLDEPGSPVFTIVEGKDGATAIQVGSRAQNFYAVDVPFAALGVTYGPAYIFRVSGRAETGITMQLGRTDEPWSAYVTGAVDANGYWLLEQTLTAFQLREHFLGNQRGVRIMTNDAPSADFIIDSIEVLRYGPIGVGEAVVPKWDLSLVSLQDAFAEHFLLGNIWSSPARMTDSNTQDGFLHHFNAVTAENHHKVDAFARVQGQRTFDTADYIVDWAEANELAMIGHTLVWHSQSPPWLTTRAGATEPLTRAEAIANMHDYVRTVAGRYSGRIYSWDVVNEAIWGVGRGDWANNPDWRAHMRQAGAGLNVYTQSQWYNAFANGAVGDECGSDFIYYAFRFARIYDPFAVLYYNDYNEHVHGKRDAIAQMVVQINERWQSDPLYDGRLLIEGIGMQAHYSLGGWMSNPRYVREALELYSATGARISITEWDITIGGNASNPATPTEQLFANQGVRFERLMGYFLDFSDYIARVSFWGLADHHSWISWGYPLLFDSSFEAKPAFFGVLSALENAPAPNISVPRIDPALLAVSMAPGQRFVYQLTATQTNFAPLHWSVVSGSLPKGLHLNARTGVIHGEAQSTGTYTVEIQVQNARGSDRQQVNLVIQ